MSGREADPSPPRPSWRQHEQFCIHLLSHSQLYTCDIIGQAISKFSPVSLNTFSLTKVCTALSVPFAAVKNFTRKHRLTAPYQLEHTVVPRLRSVGCVLSVRFVQVSVGSIISHLRDSRLLSLFWSLYTA